MPLELLLRNCARPKLNWGLVAPFQPKRTPYISIYAPPENNSKAPCYKAAFRNLSKVGRVSSARAYEYVSMSKILLKAANASP